MVSLDGTLLGRLTGTEREALESRLERRAFRKGKTMVWRGEILTRLFLIETGRAFAEYRLRRASAQLALQPGDFFGESALAEDATSDAVVRAVDDTVVLAFPAEAVRLAFQANPEASRGALERIEGRRIALWSASGVLRDFPNMN